MTYPHADYSADPTHVRLVDEDDQLVHRVEIGVIPERQRNLGCIIWRQRCFSYMWRRGTDKVYREIEYPVLPD